MTSALLYGLILGELAALSLLAWQPKWALTLGLALLMLLGG